MNLEAVPIQVLRRRENGSGVIRIPITKVSQKPDGITAEIIDELVANFDAFPLVPVDVQPHKEFAERGGFQSAFIEALAPQGDTLYADIDITVPQLFHEVVELGGWRGFSIEALNGFESQAKKIEGWVLVGGVFTNRPAVDAVFKIAADAGAGGPRLVSSVSITPEEATMSEKQPESGKQLAAAVEENKALGQEKIALEGRISTLNDEVRDLRNDKEAALTALEGAKGDAQTYEAKSKRLEVELRGAKDAVAALETSVKDLTAKIDAAESENLSAKVQQVYDAAVAQGVPPAAFVDYDAGNAAEWMRGRYANFEAFHSTAKALMGVSRDLVTESPKSGKDSEKRGSGNAKSLSADSIARLKRMGLDPKYVGIKSEGELLELKED